MTELETKIEVEDFTDELSDEALDRAEGAFSEGPFASSCIHVFMRYMLPVANR